MTFDDFNIALPILRAIKEKGYDQPTPIQVQSIPVLLNGKDLLGCAQTGTGKTAAFAIPIIQHLFSDRTRNRNQKKIKALIVTPTRELALQIKDNFCDYSKHTDLRTAVIFGGVKQGKQTATLKQGVDILIATPGRLLDLINQKYIRLNDIDYFVLDEADQMLDMGFIHDIKKILTKLPTKRQSLFFSATLPKNIVLLSEKILDNPEKITVKPEQATAERVEQVLYKVEKANKAKLLESILNEKATSSTLVFSRTKYGADKIVKKLAKAKITAEAIHGNKSQNQRQRALGNFKSGKTKVLVATDIAARGIDVSGLELVINYDLPNIPENYVHRIGRTGRAEASGIAISFCDIDERPYLYSIERLIRQQVPVITDHPFHDTRSDSEIPKKEKKPSGSKRKKRPGSKGNKSVWKRGNNRPKK